MSASTVQAELSNMDLNPEFIDRLPRLLLNSDPSIDDPVNDTGLGPHCGDFEVYNAEFGCLLKVILGESGELS